MLQNCEDHKIVNKMGTAARSWVNRKPNESMRLIVTTFIGIVFGFFIGVSFPTLSLTKLTLPSNLLPTMEYVEDQRSGLSTQRFLNVFNPLSRHNISSTRAQALNDTSKVVLPILSFDIYSFWFYKAKCSK